MRMLSDFSALEKIRLRELTRPDGVMKSWFNFPSEVHCYVVRNKEDRIVSWAAAAVDRDWWPHLAPDLMLGVFTDWDFRLHGYGFKAMRGLLTWFAKQEESKKRVFRYDPSAGAFYGKFLDVESCYEGTLKLDTFY
jgi:GNAT superfamily N-acetyltransferase